MISKQEYVNEDFPIKTDMMQFVYSTLYNSIYKQGIRQSGLYGVKSFYSHENPISFGTLFNGNEYAEIIFSKIENKKNGKLEIKLFGDDNSILSKIKFEIKNKVEEELKQKKENDEKKS